MRKKIITSSVVMVAFGIVAPNAVYAACPTTIAAFNTTGVAALRAQIFFDNYGRTCYQNMGHNDTSIGAVKAGGTYQNYYVKGRPADEYGYPFAALCSGQNLSGINTSGTYIYPPISSSGTNYTDYPRVLPILGTNTQGYYYILGSGYSNARYLASTTADHLDCASKYVQVPQSNMYMNVNTTIYMQMGCPIGYTFNGARVVYGSSLSNTFCKAQTGTACAVGKYYSTITGCTDCPPYKNISGQSTGINGMTVYGSIIGKTIGNCFLPGNTDAKGTYTFIQSNQNGPWVTPEGYARYHQWSINTCSTCYINAT